jgi:hypothetical protein
LAIRATEMRGQPGGQSRGTDEVKKDRESTGGWLRAAFALDY